MVMRHGSSFLKFYFGSIDVQHDRFTIEIPFFDFFLPRLISGQPVGQKSNFFWTADGEFNGDQDARKKFSFLRKMKKLREK